jgi:hypothetical protein
METGEAAGGGPKGSRQGLLAVNDLNFVMSPDLSVAVNNTYKNHYSQSNTYTNQQRGVLIFNSGADYGDMRCSTLNFEIDIGSNANFAYFGKNGSILNVIRSITLSSRSGDEISRVVDLNHLSQMTVPFKYSENWMSTVGQGVGVGEGIYPSGHQQAKRIFSIPLYLLSDFFAYGRLMPAMVLSGMKIDIEWEDPKIAFQAVTAQADTAATVPISEFNVRNMYISLRSVQLTDRTQRSLNEMSAVNGLEIVYCDHERTETNLNTQDLHLEVRKAASRALKAYISTRTKADTTSGLADSFRTEPFDYEQWQWQLGSLYFPQQPIKATDSSPYKAIPESYQHTLVAFNTYKGDQTRCSACPLRKRGHYLQSQAASYTAHGTNTAPTGNYTTAGGDGIVNAGSVATLFTQEFAVGDYIELDLAGTPTKHLITSIESDIKMTVTPNAAAQTNHTSWRFYKELITDDLGANYGVSRTSWHQNANRRVRQPGNADGEDGTFANGRSTICVLLERSDLFNLTGVPINNSRVLSCHAQYLTSKDRVFTIFLKYVRLARVFLNNVEVEQ